MSPVNPVGYVSLPRGGWHSDQLPAVGDDGLVPPGITGAFAILRHGDLANRRSALELVARFIENVCDDLAGHRMASIADRAELDRLRRLVYGSLPGRDQSVLDERMSA